MKALSNQLAIDIGGTFTDIVLDVGDKRFTKKVLTTPATPEVGLMRGAKSLLAEASIDFALLELFVHGTTLATNAILERRGARTALLTTQGFRDVLQIATESRFDQYDLQLELPEPLVPRELRFEVKERMDADGGVLVPLDLVHLMELASELKRLKVESVAIAFLHSHVNAAHEKKAAEVLRRELPEVCFTLSSEVCPEIKEYERTSTAVANAYVQPLMSRYLTRMQTLLQEEKFRGRLYLVTSSGALTTVETACRFPVRLVESGPAGGAMYAANIARQHDEAKVLSFDMGGTTAKVCLIKDYAPLKGRMFEVDRTKRFKKGSGLPIRIPVTEMVEIGAGGGSIARVDALGNVAVGPESASSEPGPASFGRGGTLPTVTDADLLLGLLDPATFASGAVQLDPAAAHAAFERHLGNRLGIDTAAAAYAAYEVVCENMALAARAHAAEMGEPLPEYTVIAFGGAAPLHAARVAEKLGIRRLIVPPDAGLGSAVGFLTAPIAYEIVRSTHMLLDSFDADIANRLLAEMSSEAESIIQSATRHEEAIEHRAAYLRYVGQGHELEIALPVRPLSVNDVLAMRTAFEAEYCRQFTHTIPGAPIEILNWSVRWAAEREVSADSIRPRQTAAIAQVADARKLFEPKHASWVEAKVRWRGDAELGDGIAGPALVVEKDTTTFVTETFKARRDATGSIILEQSLRP